MSGHTSETLGRGFKLSAEDPDNKRRVLVWICSIKFHRQFYVTPVLVSDWLIFCSKNLIFHQKRNENDKNTDFLMKKNKKMPNKYMK